MSFYEYENAPENVRELYEKLLQCWSRETCAPRYRPEWSKENPTLGQCSITSFLIQDILGGEVFGVLLPDGAYHCFNEVKGFRFDLTSEQFGDEALDYESAVPQRREEHFINDDKFARYKLLRSLLLGTDAPKTDRFGYVYLELRQRPELEKTAAAWFHSKWHVPESAYLECMNAYLDGSTENGWYLCLDGERIIAGMGVIDNDFHDRKDLAPNVCAVCTEPEYRCRGIAGRLLDMTVEDMRGKGVSPLYLVTDHTGFYERYGWEFFCMVQGDGEPDMTRMYIHR